MPPAYEIAWISPRDNGHLQAIGRDLRLSKQYRYYLTRTEYRAATKFDDLAAFGTTLPRIRRRIRRDLHAQAGDLGFAIAAVLALIDWQSLRLAIPPTIGRNCQIHPAAIVLANDGTALRKSLSAIAELRPAKRQFVKLLGA